RLTAVGSYTLVCDPVTEDALVIGEGQFWERVRSKKPDFADLVAGRQQAADRAGNVDGQLNGIVGLGVQTQQPLDLHFEAGLFHNLASRGGFNRLAPIYIPRWE